MSDGNGIRRPASPLPVAALRSPSCASPSNSSTRRTETRDGYAVRAMLPRPERRGLSRTGSIAELRVLLESRESSTQGCERVNEILDHQIDHLHKRKQELELMRSELLALRQRCQGMQIAQTCGILCELTRAAKANSKALCAAHPNLSRT